MSKTIRVNEYYDLFDVKDVFGGSTTAAPTNIPNNIKDSNEYNSFRGFSNWEDFIANNLTLDTLHPPNRIPVNIVEISGKYKSPQATSSIKVDENGDIWCYPPNVSVPYWSRIIFRNFDYNIQPSNLGKYYLTLGNIASNQIIQNVYPMIKSNSVETGNPAQDVFMPLPAELWKIDNSDGSIDSNPDLQYDFTNVDGITRIGRILDYNKVPLFLRFDEYPSRSKVIFSSCDKTRNPDIEFSFSYHKGQMEPIKLNLSLSANVPINDFNTNDKYNQNLSKEDIENILKSCYWCIEWICDKDVGN